MSTNYKSPSYSRNQIQTLVDSAKGGNYDAVCYLKYNALSGTQSGEYGTTFIAPSTWYITQYGVLYFVDPTPGTGLEIYIPEATADNLGKTISFVKPKLTADISPVTIKTLSGQNIGPTSTYEIVFPNEKTQLISNTWEFANTNGYKWRIGWESRNGKNIIFVDKDRNRGFTSISEAVCAITDSSLNNPYIVQIGTGEFFEDTIILPDYVSLNGINKSATKIISTLGNTLVKAGRSSQITNLTLSGANDVMAAGIEYENNTSTFGSITIEDCNFQNCFYGLYSYNPTYETYIRGSNLYMDGNTTYCVRGYSINGKLTMAVQNFTQSISPTQTSRATFGMNGSAAYLEVYNSEIRNAGGTLPTGVKYSNGTNIRLYDVFIENADIGISGCYLGQSSNIESNSLTIEGSVSSIVISHPQNYGFLQGFFDGLIEIPDGITTTYVVPGSSREFHVGGVLYQRDTVAQQKVPISTMLRIGTPLGVTEGGEITTSGSISALVASGMGYVSKSDEVVNVSWPETLVEIPSGTAQYLVYNPVTNLIIVQASQPDLIEKICFGRIIAGETAIDHIESTQVNAYHHSVQLEEMLRYGLGPVYRRGSDVTVSTALSVDVTEGAYYLGSKELTLSGGFGIN